MSAYIVEDQTINRIVDFCYSLQFATEAPLMYLKSPRKLDEPSTACAEFGAELFAMNVAAVAARYGRADDMLGGSYQYKWTAKNADLFQVAKSLDCFLYQCSEGDIPETSTLFQQLTKLRDDLTRVLVAESAEYKAAAWA